MKSIVLLTAIYGGYQERSPIYGNLFMWFLGSIEPSSESISFFSDFFAQFCKILGTESVFRKKFMISF
jgi:hypothetical protein